MIVGMHMQEMHLVYMEKCKKCMPYVRRKIRLCIRIRMCMYRSVTEELIYYIRIYIYIYIRGGPRARGRPVRTVVRNMASTLMLKAVPSETHVSTGTNCPYVSMYIIIIRLNGSILSIKNNNHTCPMSRVRPGTFIHHPGLYNTGHLPCKMAQPFQVHRTHTATSNIPQTHIRIRCCLVVVWDPCPLLYG